ncbi:hypothetical protein H4Q26_009490 [Puccinia striiformis f. sp. tritici PST-130]|nr:hypothetical protein H4Q26_009490 [Puccinia striiformis f. sp. tritici PST-130]
MLPRYSIKILVISAFLSLELPDPSIGFSAEAGEKNTSYFILFAVALSLFEKNFFQSDRINRIPQQIRRRANKFQLFGRTSIVAAKSS